MDSAAALMAAMEKSVYIIVVGLLAVGLHRRAYLKLFFFNIFFPSYVSFSKGEWTCNAWAFSRWPWRNDGGRCTYSPLLLLPFFFADVYYDRAPSVKNPSRHQIRGPATIIVLSLLTTLYLLGWVFSFLNSWNREDRRKIFVWRRWETQAFGQKFCNWKIFVKDKSVNL